MNHADRFISLVIKRARQPGIESRSLSLRSSFCCLLIFVLLLPTVLTPIASAKERDSIAARRRAKTALRKQQTEEPASASSSVTIFAGANDGTPGYADGALSQARFRNPTGVAAGPGDAIYIADSGNNRIRAISNQERSPAASSVTVSTLAGSGATGFGDGDAAAARFNNPQAIAVDLSGAVYVADTGNNRIRRIGTDGIVTTVAGDGAPGLRDGPSAQARFSAPGGIAIDAQGNLYISDTGNSAVRFISANGDVRTIAGDGTAGSDDSPRPRFNGPAGILFDGTSGYLYLADEGNHRIRRLTPIGAVITLAGTDRGYSDGAANQARFAEPSSVAIDADGKLVIADTANSLVRLIDPDLSLSGSQSAITTLAGTGKRGFADGTGNLARFSSPKGIAVVSSGAIIVADSGNHVLRRITIPPVITSITPSSALPSATVTINGAYFDARSTDRNTVRFTRSSQAGGGQTVANVTAAATTKLSVVVPPDAATGPVTVETEAGLATSPTSFEVIGTSPPAPPRPVINSFTPTSGPPRTVVSLVGFALTSDRGAPVVTFTGTNGPVPAPVVFESPTEVRVTVPNGAVTGPIRLTNSFGSAVTNGPFTVTAPQPGFEVTVAPSSAIAVQNGAAVYVVYVTSSQTTFTQLAALSTTGLPGGVGVVFDAPQITAGASSTLTVSLANANVSPGNYPFTIRASANVDGSPLVRTASATLNVMAAGQTTLSGRVLSTQKEPIPGATVSLDGRSTNTDAAGAFLIVGVTAGVDRVVMVDGRTAAVPNRSYPVINEPATIVAGQPNVIPYTFYLPPVDVQYEVPVVPNQETIATTPRLPDYRLTVPVGANLRNRDGSPVARMSVTPLPIDRIPAPLPSNVTTGEVWTAQPGGALSDLPIPVTYPNDMHASPGAQCNLYVFNHDTVHWQIYGTGRVSADGRTIAPEINPSTGQPYGLNNFAWHLAAAPPITSESSPPCITCPCQRTKQTVDLATGLKIEMATDISFGGARGQLTLTRTYTTGLAVNGFIGRFGLGTKDNYEIKLAGTFNSGGAGRVVMPEEGAGRLFNYARTDPDGSLAFSSTTTVGQLADVVRKLTDGTFEYRLGRGGLMRFNAAGRLTAIVDRNNNTTVLTYTGSNLISVTDPVGRSLTFLYDASNRITSATDPLGRIWSYAYSAFGSLTSVIDPLGKITRYAYDNVGRLRSVTDKRGTVIKQVTYDPASGRVSQQVFADGGIERYNYTLSGNVITATAVIDSLGRTETMRFNAAGYVIGTTDALGQSSVIERDLTNNLAVKTTGPCGCLEATREFDNQGNLTKLTDRLGQVEMYEYEPVFNNITRITDKLNRVTNFGYDSNGNLTSVTDALNKTNTYNYDGFGRLMSITDALNHTSHLEYDADSNVSARIDELNHRTTMEYDAVGRLTAVVDPLGRRTSMTYDPLDRILTLTDPATIKTSFTYDPNGNPARVVNGLNQRWLKTYDVKNRVVFTTDPIGRVARFQYDSESEVIAAASPSGRTTRYTYDPRSQVQTITDPFSGLVRFTYDGKGNLATLTDERGNTTTFTYDELYRLASRRDPVGQTTTFGYDAASNLIAKFDRLGRRTNIKYDELNRPIDTSYSDARVTYTYDEAYRLTRVDDTQAGSIEWTYDAADRRMTETSPFGVISYDYNNANQRISMTAADRPPVSYAYDTAGRLGTIAQGSETFTYSYDPLSRLTSLQRPNGVTTAYSYDAVNRLSRLTHNTLKSQPIEDFQYSYNADDEIISIVSLASAQTLPQAKTISAANAANRIAQFGASSFTFDMEGQTATKTNGQGVTSFEWDARGRMSRATLPNGQSASYSYDALGRRVSRTAGGVTTRFLYDRQDVVLDRGSDGSTVDYLNGLAIDEKLRQSSTATGALYFLQDHLGSTAALTNPTGNVVEQMQYEAFGESAGSALTRYGFTGRERDSLTGLLYYRARWQDPQQGRFITEDPIGFAGGINVYTYVGSGPVNFADASGLDWAASIGISGTIGGNIFPFAPGPFISGGTSIGVTSGGQLFIQFQAAGMVGLGIFGGVGIQGGVSHSSCPTAAGISTENALHAEANNGFGGFGGGAVDIGRNSQSISLPVEIKGGVGVGIMAGAGVSTTTTIATPPLIPLVRQMYNTVINAGAEVMWQMFGRLVNPANYTGYGYGTDNRR
jgi:RHS repeat-associated protein